MQVQEPRGLNYLSLTVILSDSLAELATSVSVTLSSAGLDPLVPR